MGIHTGRYAATLGMLYEATGGTNTTLYDMAFRSFSWASYCTQTNGVNLVGPGELDVWFRIHLGGGLLQMMQAMMFVPVGKPTANHLLVSYPIGVGGASVPTAVEIGTDSLAWTSSTVPSQERLLVTFVPTSVTAGGEQLPHRTVRYDRGGRKDGDDAGWWTFDSDTGMVVVQHNIAADVRVS